MAYLFVANWKMNKDFAQTIDFCTSHKDELNQLARDSHAQIVICPSFPFLFSLSELLADTKIKVGAQDCSPFEHGPYTGQVNALALKQVGCRFCIIGHSEERHYLRTSNADVAAQAVQLDKQHIEPIICIGEDLPTHKGGKTKEFLKKQLEPIIKALADTQNPITIAYEPIWAIGTGLTPDSQELTTIFQWLREQIPHHHVRLIYGGSVSPDNAPEILAIPLIEGLLIGGASLDFKKFQKIVSLRS